ncbi:MAG: hypothetical protein DCF25_20055 [Leptolyngbya foveolarum]|uniref:Uncharacterized protein n=1 Tax=Leptolyngbya foveolarum TaxID=47253 RepID=A0A2W4VW74_9CYAN|nr:MAG: hypothetical protein DCF25_20055 [Leptolyngbya foveolarum]
MLCHPFRQWAEARKLSEKSLEIARLINADDIASQSAWQLGRILKQQNNTVEAIAAYKLGKITKPSLSTGMNC